MVEYTLNNNYNQYLNANNIEQQCTICFENNREILKTTRGQLLCIGCCKKLIQTQTYANILNNFDLIALQNLHNFPQSLVNKYKRDNEMNSVKFDANYRFCSSCKSFTTFQRLNWKNVVQNEYLPIKCEQCNDQYCYLCRQAHPKKRCFEIHLDGSKNNGIDLNKADGPVRVENLTKCCPRCSIGINRNYGCHHMTCFCNFFSSYCYYYYYYYYCYYY